MKVPHNTSTIWGRRNRVMNNKKAAYHHTLCDADRLKVGRIMIPSHQNQFRTKAGQPIPQKHI